MNDALNQAKPADILLVEDSQSDVLLMQRAFVASKLLINLHHVSNGEQCLAFLRKQNDYADKPTPDLVLLDLNMPVMDGRETLQEIGKDDSLSHIPVVILTTSESEQDILGSYQQRCSSYIVKPVDFNKLKEILLSLSHYWFTVVVLPKDQT